MTFFAALGEVGSTTPLMTGGLIALILGMLVVFMVVGIIVYVVLSLEFMAIAKKARSKFHPGIAWIPAVGPALIASDIAGMPWWPVLLLIGSVIPFIGGLFSLVFAIFFIIWLWKVFERLNKPGWWAIICLIPIVNLIMIGIAAWSKN
jgi:hypothetical protein